MYVKKKGFIEAYKKTFGNITKACEAAEISRGTYYFWMKEDKEFKGIIDTTEPDELFLDIAENALVKKIQDGDITAIIFSLKTKGKKRGYIERQQFEHSGKVVLPISFELDERYKEDS